MLPPDDDLSCATAIAIARAFAPTRNQALAPINNQASAPINHQDIKLQNICDLIDYSLMDLSVDVDIEPPPKAVHPAKRMRSVFQGKEKTELLLKKVLKKKGDKPVGYGQLASEFLKRLEITPEPRRGSQVDSENPALNGLKYAWPEETFDCDEMAWELFSQLKTVIRPEEERYSMDVVPTIKGSVNYGRMNQELLWFLLAAISQLWNRDGNKDFDWYPKIHIELDKVEREHTQRDPDDKDFNACALNEMYDTFRPEMYNDHEMTRIFRDGATQVQGDRLTFQL
ncbi:Protein of unknown function [Pyronema omphalodes CBS 100304]|uniref:Uncharacterized protein n=1 Tax=Pyronema omphalodes (strain CBS 100304) TaxID=1076935 RepID=U4L6D7_PYROM|nr:Protein of unknown function [Pyronema omphalodes CBS 100304]